MLLILFIVIILFSIGLLLYANGYIKPYQPLHPPADKTNIPTIHVYCSNSDQCNGINCVNDCGSDLVCDKISSRCKKTLGGNCSTDVDCKTGLVCRNWKCINDNIDVPTENFDIELNVNKKHNKSVKWNKIDEIYPIPPRSKD